MFFLPFNGDSSPLFSLHNQLAAVGDPRNIAPVSGEMLAGLEALLTGEQRREDGGGGAAARRPGPPG